MDQGTGKPLAVLERGDTWTIIGWRNLAIVVTSHSGPNTTVAPTAWLFHDSPPELDTVVWMPGRTGHDPRSWCAPQIRKLAAAGHSVITVLPDAPPSLLCVLEAQARRTTNSRQSVRLFSNIEEASIWLAWLGDAWSGHEALPEGYELVLWIATQLATEARRAVG